MITMKGPEEFARMRRAGKVVAEIHRAVREAAVPGVSLVELDLIAAGIIEEGGCTPNFLHYHGYPAYVCLSPNNVIVHGIPDDREIKDGDILSLDAGAIYGGWHADAAITFPVGEVDQLAQRLIECTAAGLWAGIEACVPGARLGDVGAAIAAHADAEGFGIVREYTGHGIGLQMHEEPQVPNFGRPGKGMRLKAGMAVCIEPMFNVGSHETRVLDDGWSVVTADGSLSAHFEHTVAITSAGPEVLTLP